MKNIFPSLYLIFVVVCWIYVVFVLGYSGWWTICFIIFADFVDYLPSNLK